MTIIQGIKLIDPISTIEKKILSACVKELNIAFPKAVHGIESDIQNRIKTIFVDSPEFKALTENNGLLRYSFGLPQSDAIIACDAILNELANSIHVEFKQFRVAGNKVNGGIRVYGFLADFSDILGLPTSSTTTLKGDQLDWLEWLLIEGDKVIISDHNMVLGNNFPTSRSGGAVMIKVNGSAWRVPPQYSGTKNNNWITRALDDAASFVEALIAGAIEFNVKKVL